MKGQETVADKNLPKINIDELTKNAKPGLYLRVWTD